jgi:hypothetical protein
MKPKKVGEIHSPRLFAARVVKVAAPGPPEGRGSLVFEEINHGLAHSEANVHVGLGIASVVAV